MRGIEPVAEKKKESIKEQFLKYEKSIERIYWLFLGVILVTEFFASTQFAQMLGTKLAEMTKDVDPQLLMLISQSILNLRFLIAIPAFYAVFIYTEDLKKGFLLLLLVLIGWFYAFYWRKISDTVVFEALLVMVASYKKDFRKVLRFGVIIATIMTIAVVLISFVDGVPEITVQEHKTILHAFGFKKPTVLACHIMFILLTILYLRAEKIGWKEILGVFVSLVLVFLLIDRGTAAFCLCLAMVGTVVYSIFKKKGTKLTEGLVKVWGGILLIPFIVLSTVFMLLVRSYSLEPTAFYNRMPFLALLNHRLEVAHRVTHIFPFSYFGINDFVQLDKGSNYTYLDSSYSRIYVMYGIVALVLFVLIFTGLQCRLFKAKQMFRMYIVLIIAIAAVTEHYLIEPAFNTILLLPFAELVICEKGQKDIGVEKTEQS